MASKELLLKNLKTRGFEPYYCETREEGIKKVLELIPETASVGWGGSMTIDALGIKGLLKERGNTLFDRSKAANPDEMYDLLIKGNSTDYFLMSTNSMTEDGELFNIDGRGNRLAALVFGPKNVVMVLGTNKIVKDLDAAYDRVRNYVAPKNAKRLNIKAPCVITGKCADCQADGCICASMVTTRRVSPKGKVKVVIINEELGI